jgi:hypothetical protein
VRPARKDVNEGGFGAGGDGLLDLDVLEFEGDPLFQDLLQHVQLQGFRRPAIREGHLQVLVNRIRHPAVRMAP